MKRLVTPLIRLERHPLGPRGYLLGQRVHEWHLGLVAASAGLALALLVHLEAGWGVVAAGAWLFLKDWQDLFPSRRDTASWRLGVHRRVRALRATRRAGWLPPLTAAAALGTGLVNLASAVTPNSGWRAQLLHHVEPMESVPLFHALAIPLSACLVVAGVYLHRRRHRAWQLALAALVVLGLVDLLKGFDVEEALLGWAVAALLWWGREAFHVRHDPVSLSSALWRLPALGLGTAGIALTAAAVAAPAGTSLGRVSLAAADLTIWSPTPFAFRDDVAWLPIGVGLVGVAALLVAAYVVFRPLAAPRNLPDRQLRRTAFELVRAHGSDTLAFFKLRSDEHYFVGSDGCTLVGYRIENGVLLVSGDPIGPGEALAGAVRELCAFAETRGLRIATVGTSDALVPLWEQAGLRALYIGDEAIVDTGAFSLEGRAVRKVRQSVSRLEKAGFSVELRGVDGLGETTVHELEEVSSRWRGRSAERGFSMALDSLRGDHDCETTVAIARDSRGTVRGYIHFVPSYGRQAMSLSAMRRGPDAPNGLMEFLTVRSIELFRDRGIDELSLNFAAFARLLHSPVSWRERLLGSLIARANPYFQIESLYRFNAKFFPRWEPRYLLYEGVLGLPRAALAVMRAEGQLPARRG